MNPNNEEHNEEYNNIEKQHTTEMPPLNTDATQAVQIPEAVPEIPDSISYGIPDTLTGQASGAAAQHNKRIWIPVLTSSLVVLACCITLLASYIIPIIQQHGMLRGMAQIVTPMMGPTEPPRNTNVLLVGTDRDGYRTDTMMIASYNNDDGSVHVMQIPRDTYVDGNGRRDKKINSAYFSGIDQLRYEIQLAYGITIHRHLAVQLDGFVEMVDKLGGVEVDVPINMDYDDPYQDLHIHLNKGYQLLDGKKAEQFVRYRKNNDGTGYPMGDIDRMKAQKNFIMALVQKVVSANGIAKIPELIEIAQQSIKTDMVYDEAYSYISTLLSIENSKITFLEAPGDMDYRWGGWYFFVDQKEAKQMAQQYFGGGDIAVSATLKPSATPKSHPDYSDHDDVSEDERYTYYQKTPKPKSTDKPEATKRPSSDDDDDDDDINPSPTPKASVKPSEKPVASEKPSTPKPSATPVVRPTVEPEESGAAGEEADRQSAA